MGLKAFRCGKIFFKRRILFDFRLEGVGEFKPVQLQEFYSLSQLLRHHQFLSKLKLLSEFEGHKKSHAKVFPEIHFPSDFTLNYIVGDTAGEHLSCVHDIGKIADLQSFSDVMVGNKDAQPLFF